MPSVQPAFVLVVIADASPTHRERLAQLLTCEDADRLAIMVRDKTASTQTLAEAALHARKLTRDRGAKLLINDRLDVALLCDADGVHLPERGLSVSQARSLLGPARLIGASRHDLDGVLEAQRAGASYATFSPVFASPGKGAPLGVQAFATMAKSCTLPLFALGGVRASDIGALSAAGAAGVAVIREVMDASDPALAAAQLLLALQSHLPHRSLAPHGDAG